jgi:hypothetical protein
MSIRRTIICDVCGYMTPEDSSPVGWHGGVVIPGAITRSGGDRILEHVCGGCAEAILSAITKAMDDRARLMRPAKAENGDPDRPRRRVDVTLPNDLPPSDCPARDV